MSTITDPKGAKAYSVKHNLHTLFESLAAAETAHGPNGGGLQHEYLKGPPPFNRSQQRHPSAHRLH